jgi:hypothetical protein
VCRLPRIYKWSEARNVRRFTFEEYLSSLPADEQQTITVVIALMKVLLLRTLAPKRVAGLGGLLECQSCRTVGATVEYAPSELSVARSDVTAPTRSVIPLVGASLAWRNQHAERLPVWSVHGRAFRADYRAFQGDLSVQSFGR